MKNDTQITPHFAPGFYKDVPNEIYHKCPSLSKSGITKLLQSTAHYLNYKENPPESTARHFMIGSAFHAAVLEPDVWARDYVGTIPPEHGEPGKAWASKHLTTAHTLAHGGTLADAAEALGYTEKTVAKYADEAGFDLLEAHFKNRPDLAADDCQITPADVADILTMRDAVMAHPAGRWLFGGAHEVRAVEHSFWWQDAATGVHCRCRPDLMIYTEDHGWILIDLKSTQDASFFGFRRDVAKWGYHVQDAFYRDGVSEVMGAPVSKFLFVAAEKTAPFGVAAYELDDAAVQRGRVAYQSALNRWADYLANPAAHWLGYGDGSAIIQMMDVPGWAE